MRLFLLLLLSTLSFANDRDIFDSKINCGLQLAEFRKPLYGTKLHYNGKFTLQVDASKPEIIAMRFALNRIYEWMKSKNPDFEKYVSQERFWTGSRYDRRLGGEGSRGMKPGLYNGLTVSIPNAENRLENDFWGFRYEYPDEHNGRRWRTEIVISQLDRRLEVEVTVTNWTLPGFMGAVPTDPPPAVPRVVADLILPAMKTWKAYAGLTPLSADPIAIGLGDTTKLWNAIKDPNRVLPIVYISKQNTPEASYGLEPELLAKKLQGTAIVMFENPNTGPDFHEEMSHVLKRSLVTNAGYVRIYSPGLTESIIDSPDYSGYRNNLIRYLTPEDVDRMKQGENGVALAHDTLARQLTHSLQRVESTVTGAISSVDHLLHEISRREVKARETDLKVLRERLSETRAALQAAPIKVADDKPAEANVQAPTPAENIEAQNKYIHELEELMTMFEEEVAQLKDQLRDMREAGSAPQNEELEREARLQKADFYEKEYSVMRNEYKIARAEADALRDFALRPPTTVGELVDRIRPIHSSRLFITEHAIATAEKNTDFKHIPNMLEAINHAAATLHDLYFHRDPDKRSKGNVEKEFLNATGYELTLTEGKATNKQPKLVAMRQFQYDGKVVDGSPHIKIPGYGKTMARIHYYVDRERELIVILHAGEHLTTAGTSRMGG